MENIKMTKTKLGEYFHQLKAALLIGESFILYNDIIQPIEQFENIPGAHRIKHSIYIESNVVYKSVPNISDIMKEILDRKGITSLVLSYDDIDLSVIVNESEVYSLATPINNHSYNTSQTFYELVDKFNSNEETYTFSNNELYNARLGTVVIIPSETYGDVRLSKNSFPMMGVSRLNGEVNFSGRYVFGIYDAEQDLSFIEMHMKYKHCEVIHKYIYVPFKK